MRHRHLPTATLALGVVLLVDVLRVWLPSIITIFGQAASTPAELMGAFALGWFVLALAAPPLVRRLGARPVGLLAAVVLAGARLALTAAPGGRAQLWLACTGLLAGLVWLTATAVRTVRPAAGLATGLLLGAAGHALLGTDDLVWRGGWPAGTLSSLLAAAFLAGQALSTATATAAAVTPARPAVSPLDPAGDPTGLHAAAPVGRPAGPSAGGVRGWLLAGPALLLAGQVALSPALWSAALSYRHGAPDLPGLARPPAGAPSVLPALAVGLFLVGAFGPPPGRVGRLLWPVALVSGAALFAADRPGWLVPAFVLTAAGLGGCLRLADPIPTRSVGTSGDAGRRGWAAVGGMLVFAVGSVGYYAAYDLGYPNGGVPVTVALFIAAVAVGRPRGPASLGSAPAGRGSVGPESVGPGSAGGSWVRSGVVAAVVVLVAATGWLYRPAPAAPPAAPPGAVRVVAYNIRMGFGLDGRLDLAGLHRALTRTAPDVVVLSEVDRGWLLNGGHDTLTLLARRLRMPYVFAPAADPVWGDAVLSRWPVRSARTRPLPALGAPTGAQALGVTLDLGGGRRLAVVATHLQPPPDAGPVVQARAVAAFATGYAAGRPLVLAGDLNTQPGEPAFVEFTRAGLVDALAAARPLPTSPADHPREQIDHVFVSPGITAADVAAPPGTASDHLPVAVTLTLP